MFALRFISLLFFTAFVIAPLSAAESELVVRLATDKALLPVTLTVIDRDKSLSKKYLEALSQVIHYDLSHNGVTEVKPLKRQKEERETLDFPFYRQQGIAYIIQAEVLQKKISLQLISVASEEVQATPPVPLSENLAQDRTSLHQLHDLLHKNWTGQAGIASTRILYTVRNRQNLHDSRTWTADVYECDYDGANVRQITHEGNYIVTPCYIPPKVGSHVGSFFYVSYRLGQPKIFSAALKSGSGHRLTLLRGNQLMPAIDKNATAVAFISDVGGRADLFIQPFSKETGLLGKPRQLFSKANSSQASPCFSPDGQRLAFVSDKDGAPKIYLLNVKGNGKPHLLTKRNRESTAPSWSADGTKIAFTALTQGVRQIWIVDLKSQQEYQLTDGPGDKENPSFAPNSLHLVFNQTERNSSELYVIDLKQKIPVKISQGAGEKRFPSWEIRAAAH